MGERLRLAVGIMGNAATMSLYAAPILTLARVIRKRSVEEFSCVPYTVTLLNCCIYAWYGLPVVSYRWENFVMVPINGIGILLELSFIAIYIYFASANAKKRTAILTAAVILAFSTTAILSAFAIHDHVHRKILVGSVGLVASASMYGSPLVVVKQVIQTKSVEFMPFYLSFFSFLASTLWTIYGLLSRDLFIMAPNLVGCLLGMFQLMLYCKYRKRTGVVKEPTKWDVENNSNSEKIKQKLPLDVDEKEQQLQLVVSENADDNMKI